MIDSEALWVASIIIYHAIGLFCLCLSLLSLSRGSIWLLSWARGRRQIDQNKWNVVGERELEEETAPSFVHPSRILTFHNLGCIYRNPDTSSTDSVVLKSCYGSVSSGGMLAILGPSGSGKSTLLDITAGRKTTGVLSGSVKVDGRPLEKSAMSYVPQSMDFPPSLRLTEALSLVACLVLPLATTSEREDRMNEVLESLGLTSARNTLVGGWLPGGILIRGLSGGERKRLSISTGLLNKPQILILDEPTTGQDSQHAFHCMSSLKQLALREGTMIISSIHQPSKPIFDIFTDVVLLSKGRMVFSGRRELCLPWLTCKPPLGLDLGPYCPLKHGLVSDWFLDIVNISFPRPKKLYGRSLETSADLDQAAASFMEHFTMTDCESLAPQDQGTAPDPFGHATSCYIWANQVRVLAWREVTLITRNPADISGRLLINCWVGLFLGIVFWGAGGPTIDDIRSTSSALFIEVIASQLIPFIYMSLSQSDKVFFLSDARAGRICPSSYLLAKILVSLPFSLINITALSFIAYGMIGLNTAGSALILHTVLVALGFLVACQVIFLASLLAANQDQAFGFAIGFTSLSLLLSDTIIRYSDMSWTWLRSLRYLSPMWWTTRGVLRAQFQDQNYTCSGGLANAWVTREIVPSFLPLDSEVQSPFVQNLILSPGKTCVIFGPDLLAYFDSLTPMDIVILSLFGYLLGLQLLTFMALHLVKARGERR